MAGGIDLVDADELLLLPELDEAARQDEEDRKRRVASGIVLHATQPVYNPRDLVYVRDAEGNLAEGWPKPKWDAEPLLTEERIRATVAKFSDTKEIAFILHDKDVYTSQEVQAARGRLAKNPSLTYLLEVREGEPKPPHFHIVMRNYLRESRTGRAQRASIRVSTLAKALGIPENQVLVVRGRDAFPATLAYFIHQTGQAIRLGKYPYERSRVVANFDWEPYVDRYLVKREARDGLDLDFGQWIKHLDPTSKTFTQDVYLNAVLYDGLPLSEVRRRVPVLYEKYRRRFEENRKAYLRVQAPMPTGRLNFLITGLGGMGKSSMAMGLARTLYPGLSDDETFFLVGGEGVRYQSYDGQPVIIWSDETAGSLIAEFGRRQFLDIFDTAPKSSTHNVKFGEVRLLNSVNIVCSSQSYTEFLEGIAGHYTDRTGKEHEATDAGQAYRRFPVIIPLEYQDFSVGLNRGYMGESANFREFTWYEHIAGSMRALNQRLAGREALKRHYERQMLEPVREVAEKAADRIALRPEFPALPPAKTPTNTDGVDPEQLKLFDTYGQTKPPREMTDEERKQLPERARREMACERLQRYIGAVLSDIRKGKNDDGTVDLRSVDENMSYAVRCFMEAMPELRCTPIDETPF